LEILRRILLVANYGFFGSLAIGTIAMGVGGILGTTGEIDEPAEGFLWVCGGFVPFGVAYGVQKLINWILRPPEDGGED